MNTSNTTIYAFDAKTNKGVKRCTATFETNISLYRAANAVYLHDYESKDTLYDYITKLNDRISNSNVGIEQICILTVTNYIFTRVITNIKTYGYLGSESVKYNGGFACLIHIDDIEKAKSILGI